MNTLTQLLIFLVAALSLAAVKGVRHCNSVCPSFKGGWEVRDTCPAPIPGGGMKICGLLGCKIYRGGGCVCNFFGYNCDPCYCEGRRTATNEATSSCDDYHTYMSMTRREKVEHLASVHCTKQSNSTSGEVVRLQLRKSVDTIVESIADVNNDGNLTCEEFNNAYFELDGLEHLCLE